MRVAYYCVEGTTLAWQRRLLDEGCELLVYYAPTKERGVIVRHPSESVGDNIVPKTRSREQWVAWGMRDPNTIWFFDQTNAGEFADKLRASGKLVVGGGKFCDRLEHNRDFGFAIANKCGMRLPPYKSFSSVSAALTFLQSNPKQQFGDGGWAWKSNRYLEAAATYVGGQSEVIEYLQNTVLRRWGNSISCILQERIAGVALSTARWWNGQSFVGPYEGTIENKKFMNGNIGPSTGCSFNMVWFYREQKPKISRDLQFDALEAELRRNNAPAALYDINAVVDKRGAWFLEWTPRLGIDSELTSFRGISSLSTLLNRLAHGSEIADLFDTDQIYCGTRVTVPPYPAENRVLGDEKITVSVHGADGVWAKKFVGVGVRYSKTTKTLEVADPYGLVGIIVQAGNDLEHCYNKINDYLEHDLRIANKQYRTDAAQVIAKDIARMDRAGYGTTAALQTLPEVA